MWKNQNPVDYHILLSFSYWNCDLGDVPHFQTPKWPNEVPRRHWTCSAGPEHIFPSKWRTIKPSYFQTNPLKKSCMLVPQASSTITTTSRASDDVLVHGWKRNSMLRGPGLVSHKSVWKWTIPICGHLGNRGWSNLGAFSNSICSIRGAPKSQFASDAHPSGESQSWCCRTSRFATTPILRFYVVYPAYRADLALLFILLVM